MFGAVVFLLTCFITVAGVIYLFNYDKVNSWIAMKHQTAWTTYYFKTRECEHIHLVPLDGRDHYTAEDGDCRCHTSRIVSDGDKTFVYQHQRLSV